MRKCIRDFVRLLASALPVPEPIYEFGSLQVVGTGAEIDLRPFFSGKEYIGCDMREGPGVDRVLDLHNIDLPAETAGTVLVMETLEHVEYPQKAIEEVYRITRPNGVVVISSAMNFPIHDHPYDYWRFTPEAFKSLLRPFASCWVDTAGEPDFPHAVVGIGFKGEALPMESFISEISGWKTRWFFQEGDPWKQFRRQLYPPIIRTTRLKIKKMFKQPRSQDGKK